jgi:uncharacterized protein
MERNMDRDDALRLVLAKVENENLVRHMLATEAIMADLADRLGEDRGRWAMAGLLHDLDVTQTVETPEVHAVRAVEWLRAAGFDDEAVLQAILAHNAGNNGCTVSCAMDQALIAADRLSGLITAAALIRPEKKLELVKAKSLAKRYREPAFARGASREDIATCEAIGVPLDEFLALGLAAMQGVSEDLGL